MRRKNSLIIPAVLAFSLCTVNAVPVLAEDAAQTEAEADTASDEASDAAEDTADTPYEKGTITETDYQSEWLNLKFTPPETVVMNTEEELESVMRQGQSTLEESSGMELGEDALSGTVYEMMASSVSGFPNVSLVVEDAAQQMLDATQMGYTYSEVTDAQIGGQDFRVMETSVTINDYEVLQKYCTRKQGGKFVSIILSYTADTQTEADEVLAAFTPLNADTEAAPAE